MGAEAKCTARYKRQSVDGKALLETDHVLFRGGDLRLKLMFKDLKSVKASEGALTLSTAEGPLVLLLGAQAGKWADKILNPPSLLDKLGVKPGSEVALIGDFDEAFHEELQSRGAKPTTAAADLVFYSCAARADLARIGALTARLKPAVGLWVIYPKGVKPITEIDVLNAGRDAGLKDVKVCSFSPTHTGLKFVIPIAARKSHT
jgi:hypothetical protein